MSGTELILAAISVVLGIPGLLTTIHLSVLAIASAFYRERLPARPVPSVRFLVVVPAHNEELVLGPTLQAICADLRPRDQLLVVDDRSSDRTGEIAIASGAMVLRREPGDEPGRAATRQAALARSTSLEWDAMVMIDADSIVSPGFFDVCERMLATGAVAMQARSEASIGRSLVDQAALASFAVQGVLMPRGRDRLRLLVRLRGTGMVLRRDVIERFSFRAPASEDLVYSLDLCLAAIRVRHVESARLRSQNAGSWRTATQQKLRYEAGRMAAASEFFRPLVAHSGLAGFEAGWFLLSPPFATAVTLLSLATGLAVVSGVIVLTATFALALVAMALVLLLAIVQARLHPRIVFALAMAPAYLVWKLFVQVRAAAIMRRSAREFGATERHQR